MNQRVALDAIYYLKVRLDMKHCLRLMVLFFLLTVGANGVIAQSYQFSESSLPSLANTARLNVTSPDHFPDKELKWRWSSQVFDGSTTFLRIHIIARSFPTNNSWFIVVLDASGHEVDRLTFSRFNGEAPNAELWTRRVWGNLISIELHSDGEISGLRLELDEIYYPYTKPSPQAIVDGDQRVELLSSYGAKHNFYKWSTPIAAIFFISAEEKKDTNCTGSLLTPTLLLTNQHCIHEPWQLETAEARFGFDSAETALKAPSFRIKRIECIDPVLDFAILRLDSPAMTWSTVHVTFNKLRKGENLLLIQHPDGHPKMMSKTGCKVEEVQVLDRITDFFHLCDSDGGSSGSPIMDRDTGLVVGLHHIGRRDPRPGKDYHNLGINMLAILTKVRDSNDALYREIGIPVP